MPVTGTVIIRVSDRDRDSPATVTEAASEPA